MRILNKLLLASLLALSLTANSQNLSQMTLVSSTYSSGDTYEIDPSSIQLLPDGSRSAWFRFKRGYKETPRPIFDDFDSRLQKQAYNCTNGSFVIYEVRTLDKSGNVIKFDFAFQPDDPRLSPITIGKGSVGELNMRFVCDYKIGGSSGSSSTAVNSTLLAKYPPNTEWASLGPDVSNSYTVYLLKESVIKKGNFVGYISKIEYAPPIQSEGKTIKTTITENVYDCRISKYQMLKSESLSPQGTVALESKIDPEFAPWGNAPKGSFFERIGSVYCKK